MVAVTVVAPAQFPRVRLRSRAGWSPSRGGVSGGGGGEGRPVVTLAGGHPVSGSPPCLLFLKTTLLLKDRRVIRTVLLRENPEVLSPIKFVFVLSARISGTFSLWAFFFFFHLNFLMSASVILKDKSFVCDWLIIN